MDELEEIRMRKLRERMREIKMRESSGQLQIEVNDINFREKVLEQSKKVPVVVDFWAAWCMPCMILGPVLEKLTKESGGKFILAKANVDEARTVAQTYSIMSIPSVKMFKDGKVVDEFVGALPEPAVRQWLERNLT